MMELESKKMAPWKWGLGIFLVGTLLFAWIAREAALPPGSSGTPFDIACAQKMKDWAENHPSVRFVFARLTLLGGVSFLAALALAGTTWQWSKGQRLLGAGWLCTALVGSLLNWGIKTTVVRERPPEDWRDPVALKEVQNESFPSGHSMGSAIGYGLLAYVLVLENRRWRSQVFIVVGLALLAMLIAFSRIFLRAHWVTDVLGGFTLGLAWLALCLGVLETLRSSSTFTSAVDVNK